MSEEIRRVMPRQYYTNHYSNITFKTSFQNCVLKALQNRCWKQIQSPGWNLQWSQKQRVNDVFQQGLIATQRCNHFRLWGQLCRKDMMIKNIRKHKRQLIKNKIYVEQEWNFLPLTFFLPSQYIMFAQQFKKKGGLWIMKPTSRCQGQGIFIIDKLSQVAPYRHKVVPATQAPVSIPPKPPVPSIKKAKQVVQESSEQNEDQQKQQITEQQSESYLIQQYILKPLLFGGKKFDLRIYCLCTNYSQLTAWLYRSGFARFTHQPYNTQNIDNLQSHLTNVQIQKHSQNYDQIRGGKWLVDKLKHYMFSAFPSQKVDWCFTEIKNIIIRSLESVQKNILASKNSFQLYGYDFMIDENLKPILIQINGGPSMTANTDFDCRLKCGLIDDVLTIVDIQGILNGDQMSVGGFDLIVDKGVKIRQNPKSQYTGLLGGKNQRKKVVRNIVKRFMLKKKKQQIQKQLKQNENEQKILKKKGKQVKQKLLPSFYYNKPKCDNGDQNNIENLKRQLKILQINDKNENVFRPLNI